jgi:2-methylisocitrate lyase-like PEP mutase family enzyme
MDGSVLLRDMLAGKGLIIAPGVYDALTARIAQYAGFKALYMSGFGTSASFGYPDIGLLTMSEMAENVRRICDAVELPLIADADTGYGSSANVFRTVREYEKAGAAAIQLEDQAWPKRSGGMKGKQIIGAAEMVEKIRTAVEARVSAKTVLVIRTDAIAAEGFEKAVERAEAYAEAGADVLFIEAMTNDEEVLRVPSLFSKPCLLNKSHSAKGMGLKTIEEIGYRLVIFPSVALWGAIEGSLRACMSLMKDGTPQEARDLPFGKDGLGPFLGIDRFMK